MTVLADFLVVRRRLAELLELPIKERLLFEKEKNKIYIK